MWACVNRSLSFLFLADGNGTQCGLLFLHQQAWNIQGLLPLLRIQEEKS